MAFKKSFMLLVATATTPFFAFVSIIFEQGCRLVKIMPFLKRKILLKTFIESQFSYCPLIWMFHNRKLNRKINHIQERALRLVYDDYTSSFKDLLQKDGSVSVHHQNIHFIKSHLRRRCDLLKWKFTAAACPIFLCSLDSSKLGYQARLVLVEVSN